MAEDDTTDRQVVAEGDPGERGRVSIGAWLSPQAPSSATLMLDDIQFGPVSETELQAWLKPHEPRPPLTKTELPDKRGVFRAPGRVGMATASMAIAFDEGTGDVANLVDRASGREFIEARARRPLFTLILTRPREGERREISAADFTRVYNTQVQAYRSAYGGNLNTQLLKQLYLEGGYRRSDRIYYDPQAPFQGKGNTADLFLLLLEFLAFLLLRFLPLFLLLLQVLAVLLLHFMFLFLLVFQVLAVQFPLFHFLILFLRHLFASFIPSISRSSYPI